MLFGWLILRVGYKPGKESLDISFTKQPIFFSSRFPPVGGHEKSWKEEANIDGPEKA